MTKLTSAVKNVINFVINKNILKNSINPSNLLKNNNLEGFIRNWHALCSSLGESLKKEKNKKGGKSHDVSKI